MTSGALKPALKQIYPTVPIQLCHNHYFEILRQMLRIRTEEKYHDFFYELKGAFNAQFRQQCPNTTNIIESYNSHLQARLKSVKGFQGFHSAERWLNAWMIRRRTKSFTDCEEPFKHLNGKCPLEVALKKDVEFPEILGIKRKAQ